MSNEIQELLIRKNNYFRDKYQTLVKCLMAMIIVCMVLVSVMVFFCFVQKQPKYYASTTNGEQVELNALSTAVLTDDLLLKWAEVSAKTAYNINFSSYQSDLDKAKSNFTSSGWSSFSDALTSSGLLGDVTGKKLILSAIVSGTPVIIQRGIQHGKYYWIVQMPMMMTESSASQQEKKNLLVTMKVTRVTGLDSAPDGILISDFHTSMRQSTGSV